MSNIEEREAAHRRLCREIASQIIAAMAFRDMGFEEMADRIGSTPLALRRKLDRLIAGTAITLRDASDMACSLNCRLSIHFVPREPEAPPATNSADSGHAPKADGATSNPVSQESTKP